MTANYLSLFSHSTNSSGSVLFIRDTDNIDFFFYTLTAAAAAAAAHDTHMCGGNWNRLFSAYELIKSEENIVVGLQKGFKKIRCDPKKV
jgi:hypothetical protein